MEKQIISYYPSSHTGVLELVNPSVMEKTAGVAEDIVKFLNSLVVKEDKSYALINALSAGEHWGSNMNGDWFSQEELLKYYKTFEALGHVYELHVNKDPKKSLGKVLFAYYNPNMHRVELVVELDNSRAKHVLDRARNGELLATSMGTRVSYERCSICGNISKTLSARCGCLKNKMNQIYPDGRKVYAENYRPKFFDISIVRIGADKTSRIVRMIKIAPDSNDQSKKIVIFEKKLDSNLNNCYTKVANFETSAEIKKEIPAKVEILSDSESFQDISKLVKERLRKDVLYKLSEYPLVDTMSTLLALRILPDPRDFQKLALYSLGERQLADELEKNGEVFSSLNDGDEILIPEEVTLENASEKIANLLAEEVPLHSNLELWELSRGIEKISAYNEKGEWYPDEPSADQRSFLSKMFFTQKDTPKKSPTKNPVIPLGILGSLYYGYSKIFKKTSPEKFKGFLHKYPWLLPVIVGGASLGTVKLQENTFMKEASLAGRALKSGLVAFPTSYYMAGKKEYEARKGKKLGAVEDFVRKHPALIGLVGTFAGNKLQKSLKGSKFGSMLKVSELLLQVDKKVLNTIQKDLSEVNT